MTNKTISINPALFSMGGATKTKKNRKTPKPLPPLISPNILKNKLLKRIKEHKKKETTGLENKNPANTGVAINITTELNDISNFSNEFNDSINYLQNLSKQKKKEDEKERFEKEKQKRRERIEQMTLKNYQTLNSSSPYVNIDLPEELLTPVIPVNITEPITLVTYPRDSVPYGVLKGGIKPTYREWTQKQRNTEFANPNACLTIHGGVNTQSTERENRLKRLREKINLKQMIETSQKKNENEHILMTTNLIKKHLNNNQQNISENLVSLNNNQINPGEKVSENVSNNSTNSTNNTIINNDNEELKKQIIKKTIKRKYTLGKSKTKNKVAVLLKDRGTRKQIISAQKDLKRKPLNDIKNYLRDHNLIKIGSNAPNDVIRKLYESCMLAGEVTNSNTDTLLHNLIKDDKEI